MNKRSLTAWLYTAVGCLSLLSWAACKNEDADCSDNQTATARLDVFVPTAEVYSAKDAFSRDVKRVSVTVQGDTGEAYQQEPVDVMLDPLVSSGYYCKGGGRIVACTATPDGDKVRLSLRLLAYASGPVSIKLEWGTPGSANLLYSGRLKWSGIHSMECGWYSYSDLTPAPDSDGGTDAGTFDAAAPMSDTMPAHDAATPDAATADSATPDAAL